MVGATRILRPAVASLLRGTSVVGVARDARELATVALPGRTTQSRFVPLAFDASDGSFPAVLASALDRSGLRLGGMLVYGPTSSPSVIDVLTTAAEPAPLVEILTSAAAAPLDTEHTWSLDDLPPAPAHRRRLVLGWQPGPGGPRWHRPDEVSAAALAALSRQGDRQLGVVTPWTQRPR